MKIGIGITTRNRPQLLHLALKHHAEFRPNNAEYLVVDDNSDPFIPGYATPPNHDVMRRFSVFGKVQKGFEPETVADMWYLWLHERHGVAKAKNRCIKHFTDCDWVFLFDDDCFPVRNGWEKHFIEAAEFHAVHHLSYLVEVDAIELAKSEKHVDIWTNGLGCCLLWSKKALEVLGGMDPDMGKWGYEHAQMSQRAAAAKLCPFPYMAPKSCQDWLYAADIDWGHKHTHPPLGRVEFEFKSSMPDSEKEIEVKKGAGRVYDMPIHMDI